MAFSTQRTTSDGTLVLLDIAIEYFDRTEISVLFNGIVDAYTWAWVGTTESKISFTPAIPNGVEVMLVRTTDLSEVRHNFTLGARFTTESLDEDLVQILHIAQEARENATIEEVFHDLNMHGYRITNVGDGLLPSDVVNVGQLVTHDATIVAYRDQTAAYAADAAASAADAAASAASIAYPIPVVSGGTGGTTAADARTNLGVAKSGANSDITSLAGITSVNGGAVGARRNKLINNNFAVNVRNYASGAAAGVDLYGHDRWKVAAAADTYTFVTTGGITTVTIPVGKVLRQVILGSSLEGGTYTLSWTGTSQGKIGAGAYGTSGVTGAIVAGTDTTVEFGPGTLSLPQLELGSVATVVERRTLDEEVLACWPYTPWWDADTANKFLGMGQAYNTTICAILLPISPPARIPPVGVTGLSVGAGYAVTAATSTSLAVTSLAFAHASKTQMTLSATTAGGLVAGNATQLLSTGAAVRLLGRGCEL